MKRWNVGEMEAIGRKIFAKVHRQKHHTHHNHDVHFLAREINDWLPKGVQSMIDGTYIPRHLKRYYFKEEMIDQLHLSDRILHAYPPKTTQAHFFLCYESKLLSPSWSQWGKVGHSVH